MKLTKQYCFGGADQEEAAGNRPLGNFRSSAALGELQSLIHKPYHLSHQPTCLAWWLP
jgi:hypothetical protein